MAGRSFFSWILAFLILAFQHVAGVPSVAELDPFVGPSTGGTVVSITGTGFNGATAVSFGSVPAASFVVNSDSSITATSPVHSPQTVSITVTTASGTSPVSQDSFFAYQGNGIAYVANYGSGSATVIDTAADLVIANPAAGANPRAVAILPDGTKAYVANNGANSVSVFNTSNQTLITTIPVGLFPYAIGITPDGSTAYVVNNNDGTVQAIDTATDTVVATMFVGGNPNAIAILPNGTKAYVTSSGSDEFSVIDTSSNTVITDSPLKAAPFTIVITPDGTQALITNNPGEVTFIDTTTDTIVIAIDVGMAPCAIAITPDGTKAYVANRDSMSVSVVDISTRTVSATIPVGISPDAVIVRPDGAAVYVVNSNTGTVSVIDTVSDSVVASVVVGNNPRAIAMTPDGSKAYVVNSTSDDVSVIQTVSNTVSATVISEIFPLAISIAPDQAPLAKFSFISENLTFTFDASASVSPVGTIANYFWDFGDGTTLNTAVPVVVHVYAAAGSYTVTLTVTNTAGTSAVQIFNPASSNDLSFNATFLTHNGGPSAVMVQTIDININPAPLPPRNLRARQIKDRFLLQTELMNVITWQAPVSGPTPVLYKIYRNASLTRLAGTVPADRSLKFIDHNRQKGRVYTYFIVSVDQFGNQSAPAEIVVREK